MRYGMLGVWGALLCSQMGCYDGHGSDVDEAGSPFVFDAGPPTDGARPPEPEPNPDEPLAPPIDLAPPIGPTERALVPVGEPIPLDDETYPGGPPSLVWNGAGWGVLWGAFRTSRFQILDPSGRPTSATTTAPFGALRAGLDFAGGRYAIVIGSGQAASFDRDANQIAGWSSVESGVESDVARLSVDHRWLVVQTDADSDGQRVSGYELEDDMTTVAGAPIVLGGDSVGDVRVAGASTRALAVWMTPARVLGRIVRGRPFETTGEVFDILPSGGSTDSATAVELFGDRFVVVALQGLEVYGRFVDPFAASPLDSEPFLIGPGRADARPGIATAPERGFFAACWGIGWGHDGTGDRDGVVLQVIGSDGVRWGAPLQLVSGERNISGVSCGWNGSEIVVLWWRASGDAHNAVFSQRVRPTFL